MYRPVQNQQGKSSDIFFSDRNYHTLKTVLVQDFEQRNGIQLNNQQIERLSKTLNHYINQVYNVQGEKPVPVLNKDVLSACAKDFSQYLQRKEITKNISPVKTVMDESLFQETSQRFERLTQERHEVKQLPPSMPDLRVDFKEDGPPAAELFEYAKKQREMEALRSAQQNNELIKADAGLQSRIIADSTFKIQQDSQNRNSELALIQRQEIMKQPSMSIHDTTLAVMPDRRELLLAPVGSFDTMTGSPTPRDLGQANSNPTIVEPRLASPEIKHLPQNYLPREDNIVSYHEIENNLFIYSADRDWLVNTKENRYKFSVNFDPVGIKDEFRPNISSQEKFKNIVRIELVKCIMPGESLDVSIDRSTNTLNTTYQDNILNLPYVTVRVEELDNNNYGTDNYLDRSFGVLQYDAQWISDKSEQESCTKGFLAMIPKFLKCQKVFYPTPLSTLQRMTIDIRRPNGELISTTSDTHDIIGILGAGATTATTIYPFNVLTSSSVYNLSSSNNPVNFFVITDKFFSRFDICTKDRIQLKGYSYSDSALATVAGDSLRKFSDWINRIEGHIVINTGYTDISAGNTIILDGYNSVGYANVIIIQALYNDPTTGSTDLDTFSAPATNFSDTIVANSAELELPCRAIDLNKQLHLVFRVITREMDSLPQLRPDNNY